jgi:hypothetical protein
MDRTCAFARPGCHEKYVRRRRQEPDESWSGRRFGRTGTRLFGNPFEVNQHASAVKSSHVGSSPSQRHGGRHDRPRRLHPSTGRNILHWGSRGRGGVRTEYVHGLSATEAGQLLRSPSSSQAFTDLGFPVSQTTALDPTYSQCRFTARSSRSQIRLIINADLAKAPSVSIQAIAARTRPGARILTIDRALAVWLPWTQQDLRGQGGVLNSAKDGDYIAVVLIYVHRDPLRAAEGAIRLALPRISNSR